MTLALAAYAVLILVWTCIPIFRHEAWWVRVFEFPRVQLVALALSGLGASLMVLPPNSPEAFTLCGLFALCAGFQFWWIWPYTRAYPTQVKLAVARRPTDEISLLVGNVLMSNRQAHEFLKIVRNEDPDFVLAVETDHWRQTELDHLETDYPHTLKQPLDNYYGMHLYSKLPLVDPELLYLVEDGVPSIHTGLTLRSGRQVQLHCLHPAPPSPTENATSIERDAELLTVAKIIDATKQSVIVAGDLNDVAWSATTRLFRKTSQLLDPRIGRGIFNTFHAKLPFLRWPLDHVFHSADFELVALKRLPAFGSDHFPIYAALQLQAETPNVHDHPEASVQDEALAEEKIEKADVDDNAVRAMRRPSG